MVFRKIDEDAANPDQPFDSFILKGVRDNINAAYLGRPRRVSQTFAADVRPVLHGYPDELVYILGVFPISDPARVSKVRCTFFMEIQDSYVEVAPIFYENIQLSEPTSSTTQGIGSRVFQLEWDVRSQGSDAILAIKINSTPDTASKQTVTFTSGSTSFIKNLDGYYDLGASSGVTLDFDKRYVLSFDSASVSLPESIANREFLIADHHSNRYIKIFPPIANSLIERTLENNTFDVNITPIGSAILKGYTLTEFINGDGAESDAPLKTASTTTVRVTNYDPYYPTDFQNINNLHGFEYDFYKNFTPIYHFGGTNDRNNEDIHGRNICPVGEVVFCADSDWRDVGACIIPKRDNDKIDVNGTEYDRTKIIITGIAMCAIRGEDRQYADEMQGRIRATLSSFGTDWDQDEVNLPISPGFVTGATLDVPIRGDATPWIADAIPASGTAGGALTFHTMRGLFKYKATPNEIRRGNVFIPFYFEVDDEFTDVERMLRIQFKGSDYTRDGLRVLNGRGLFIYVPSFTVFLAQEGK